jgi:hypothetical protein
MAASPAGLTSISVERIAVVGFFLIVAALVAAAGGRQARSVADRRDAGADAVPVPAALPSIVPPAPLFPPAALRPASPGNCVEVVCAHLAGGSCRKDELVTIAQLCASQYSGECIADACDRLGPFACKTIDAVRRVAPACRGQIGAGCLRSVCRQAGPLGCDDLRKVNVALEGCAGNVDGSCVDVVCGQLGPLGCDGLEKTARIARACGEGR